MQPTTFSFGAPTIRFGISNAQKKRQEQAALQLQKAHLRNRMLEADISEVITEMGRHKGTPMMTELIDIAVEKFNALSFPSLDTTLRQAETAESKAKLKRNQARVLDEQADQLLESTLEKVESLSEAEAKAALLKVKQKRTQAEKLRQAAERLEIIQKEQDSSAKYNPPAMARELERAWTALGQIFSGSERIPAKLETAYLQAMQRYSESLPVKPEGLGWERRYRLKKDE